MFDKSGEHKFSLTFTIISIIFTIALVILLFRSLFVVGGSQFTFTNLLDFFSNCKFINLSYSDVSALQIYGSWGVFDFLRLFLNSIVSFAYVPVFLSAGVLNFISFLLYCLAFILGF